MRQVDRRLDRLVEDLHLVMLLQNAGDAAQHEDRQPLPIGSSILTTWKRRVSAGSFSICCLYSAQVVAAMVRNSPRASAGFRRLAASPVPAAPPAPIRVCASSMNRMTGVSDACTSSITAFSRFSNSPLTLAPACISPTSSMRTLIALQRRRHVALGDAQREALDDRGLADAGLAGQDRIVLPAPHQDIDDLPDLRIAADDGIDLAVARTLRQVGRVFRQGGVARRRPPRRLAQSGPLLPAPTLRASLPPPRRTVR